MKVFHWKNQPKITIFCCIFFRFPSIADLKLGDIYMIVNFFFVFGALIEFAMVNTGRPPKTIAPKSSIQKQQYQNVPVSDAAEQSPDCKSENKPDSTEIRMPTKPKVNWYDIDSMSKKAFPSLFLIWNVLYFGIGMSLSLSH